jgi:hypothetical protein
MELEGPLSCSQLHTIYPYPEPDEYNQYRYIVFQ